MATVMSWPPAPGWSAVMVMPSLVVSVAAPREPVRPRMSHTSKSVLSVPVHTVTPLWAAGVIGSAWTGVLETCTPTTAAMTHQKQNL